MGNRAREERPRGLRPVKRIELSESNIRQRWILIIVFLVIAGVALGYGLYALLRTEPGWIEVEVSAAELHCGEDFIFSYFIGEGEQSPAEEKRLLTALYSEATVKAYRWFNRYEAFEGVINVHYLNAHPNEELTVDPVLYQAFATALANGDRRLYLGALAEEYEILFFGGNPYPGAEEYDPYRNAEFTEICRRMAAYASNPADITLELLGENRVCLRVSAEYLAYAAEQQVTVFVDFFRMKNAFIIDYLADVMLRNQLTHGCISSYDGYVRNLDTSETDYSINLFDLQGTSVYNVGTMTYRGAASMISLRSYAMGEKDATFYYTCSDGTVISPYLDPADGLYRTATDSLVVYSETLSCAELLLRTLPIYVAQTLSEEALSAVHAEGVRSIWFGENTLYYNDESLRLSALYRDDERSYASVYVAP